MHFVYTTENCELCISLKTRHLNRGHPPPPQKSEKNLFRDVLFYSTSLIFTCKKLKLIYEIKIIMRKDMNINMILDSVYSLNSCFDFLKFIN